MNTKSVCSWNGQTNYSDHFWLSQWQDEGICMYLTPHPMNTLLRWFIHKPQQSLNSLGNTEVFTVVWQNGKLVLYVGVQTSFFGS